MKQEKEEEREANCDAPDGAGSHVELMMSTQMPLVWAGRRERERE